MRKQWVKWKPIQDKNVRGESFESELPDIIELRYRGSLIAEISAMPKKTQISFAAAVLLTSQQLSEAFDSRQIGNARGEYHWYITNFVKWISEQGYHIELTGDEFESQVPGAWRHHRQ